MTSRRKPWIAGVLSVLEPGLGHLYSGQGRKAFVIFLLPLFLYPLMYFLISTDHIVALLVTIALLAVFFYVFVLIDAIRYSRTLGNEYEAQWFNKWYVYVAVVAGVYAVSSSTGYLFKSHLFQAFKIPAASMEPTLKIGDHIFVDRRPSARTPSRGDLIVFQFPRDPKVEFIKRVAATAGDTLEIRNKVVYVNGSPIEELYAMHSDNRTISAGGEPRDNIGPTVIPPGSYFVLGDNRDNSFDSRYWGIVSSEQVRGTARTIYWSWDKSSSSVRWDRIGEQIK